VLACGPDDALDRLKTWLHDGSPAAKVTDVTAEPADDAPPGEFTTG